MFGENVCELPDAPDGSFPRSGTDDALEKSTPYALDGDVARRTPPGVTARSVVMSKGATRRGFRGEDGMGSFVLVRFDRYDWMLFDKNEDENGEGIGIGNGE